MKKIALVFVLAVFAPSLVLAWLAVRSLRDQQLVLERQQRKVGLNYPSDFELWNQPESVLIFDRAQLGRFETVSGQPLCAHDRRPVWII